MIAMYIRPLLASLVLVFALLCQPLSAAEFGLFGVDLRAGVSDSNIGDGFGFALGVPILKLDDGLLVQAGLLYAESSGEIEDGPFIANAKLEEVGIGAEIRYYFRGEPGGFYAGGGPYLLEKSSTYTITQCFANPNVCISTLPVNQSGNTTALVGDAGYEFGSADSLRFALEFRYISSSGGTYILGGGISW